MYKGIFWITDVENLDNNEPYLFKILTNENGEVLGSEFELNAKSKQTYNHKKTWKLLSNKLCCGKEFDYYPRGRIEIKNSTAIIYLNPNIATDEIIDYLIKVFEININTKIIKDNSEHYQCYLDKESKVTKKLIDEMLEKHKKAMEILEKYKKEYGVEEGIKRYERLLKKDAELKEAFGDKAGVFFDGEVAPDLPEYDEEDFYHNCAKKLDLF